MTTNLLEAWLIVVGPLIEQRLYRDEYAGETLSRAPCRPWPCSARQTAL